MSKGHYSPKLTSVVLLTKFGIHRALFTIFDLWWPFGSHRALFTIFDLCSPLNSTKVIIILILYQQFFWPSLVAIEHCLLYLIFDLCWLLTSTRSSSFLACNASAVLLTKFGRYRALFTIFDLCWPLTSTKYIKILSLHQQSFWKTCQRCERTQIKKWGKTAVNWVKMPKIGWKYWIWTTLVWLWPTSFSWIFGKKMCISVFIYAC